jgi:hypothetical protein
MAVNMSNDPEKGEGWDFMDDQSDAWYDAFETVETDEGETKIDVDAYDEFDTVLEIVNYVAGQNQYSDTRQFTPGEKDLQMKKREMHNDKWKIPAQLEQISEYLEQEDNLAPNEIDLDPSAEVELKVTETEAQMRDADTKYTMHFIAYDEDEDLEQQNGEPDGQFYIQGSWYDTPPEEMNLEDVFESVMTREEE